MGFEYWLQSVDATMLETYAVTLVDLGAQDDDRWERYWMSGDTPQEFVAWFGEKYELIATTNKLGTR